MATWIEAHQAALNALPPLVILAGSELLVIAVGLARFGAMPATHTYAAKLYGILIFVAFLLVLGLGFGAWTFWFLSIIGVAANVEILVILALSQTAPVDVLSIFHLKRQK